MPKSSVEQIILGDRLPGFGGLAMSSLKIVAQDRSCAVSAMRTIDTNKAGVMTREELRISRYKKYEEHYFRYDANRNRQLTVSELASSYARIRVDKASAARAGARQQVVVEEMLAEPTLVTSFQWSGGTNVVSGDLVVHIGATESTRLNRQSVQNLGLKIFHQHGEMSYFVITQERVGAAQEVIRHYDEHGNGILEREELQRIEGRINLADADAMPPFHGPLKPEGADSEEKLGLGSYHGERSKGEWRLIVRAERSNRAGLLVNALRPLRFMTCTDLNIADDFVGSDVATRLLKASQVTSSSFFVSPLHSESIH